MGGMGPSAGEVISLLSDLVAIPSINPAFRQQGDVDAWFGEAKAAQYVARWLRELGLDVELDEVLPGRANVVATLKGTRGGRLLWEGHTDTVQVAGMSIPPFAPQVREGRLYGRGAVDDKGCLTAMMLALADLRRDPPAVDVTFVAAVDEEYQYRGVLHHLRRGEDAIGGIAGEPTDLRIVTACKGCMRWRIEVKGKSAHSSQPQEGIDAIAIASDLLAHLRSVYGPVLAARIHPLVGSPTLICSLIEGGQGPNTVAERCLLTFDRRTQPGETGMAAWQEIDTLVKAYAATLPPGAALINHLPFIDSISMEVAPEVAIVRAARRVCRDHGLDDAIMGVAFGSDASKMTAAGIPTIVFGPGSIDQAHTADEFVAVDEVAKAARMLAAMAREIDGD
jgi:succinyl-diaminopimelate desuccinylase